MPENYEIPSLTGERVALRPPEPEEEGLMQRWFLESDPLTQTCRPPAHRSLNEAATGRRRRKPDASQGTFAIIQSGTGTLVGRIRYFNLNFRNRSAEIGYLMAPAARGKGLGREAVSVLVSYLFKGLGLNKVYAQTAANNNESKKLLESLGFHRDAVLREHHLFDGELHDDYVYSVLQREWQTVKDG